jgi:hypothetical protein
MSAGQQRMRRRGIPPFLGVGNINTDIRCNLVELGFGLGVSASDK